MDLNKHAVTLGQIEATEKKARIQYLSNRTTDNKELWNRVVDQKFVPLEIALRAVAEAERIELLGAKT